VVQNRNKGCGGTTFAGIDIIETKAGFVVRPAYIPSCSPSLLWVISGPISSSGSLISWLDIVPVFSFPFRTIAISHYDHDYNF